MNVLISGIAGDIGFGSGRILRDWGWTGLLHGIDVQSEHPGECVFDHHAVAPLALDETYMSWLRRYIEQHNIGLVIPASEAEITVLSEQEISEIGGARILIVNRQAIAHSLDKRSCMTFLAERGVRVPENGVVGLSEPSTYPVIVKPRFGQGNKQIQQIDNAQIFAKRAILGQIWQEYLAPDDQEYTCPIYNSKERGLKTLIMRRTLTPTGVTGRGEVVRDESIEEYITEIANHLKFNGSINIQLRVTPSGPCLFEINPRLSSTLVFRDKMGFTDLRWWIQDVLGETKTPPLPSYVPPEPGTRFFLGAQEYICKK